MQIIFSNNDGLQMQKGFALAIITNQGKISQEWLLSQWSLKPCWPTLLKPFVLSLQVLTLIILKNLNS